MKFFDWLVVGFLILLAVIIDPTDIVDFGMPILEPILAIAYYIKRKDAGEKTK